jgi:hypothetical protein
MAVIVHLLIIGFVAVVLLVAFVFLVIDMFGRVDYFGDKFPWLERFLSRRRAFAGLLLVAICLLIGDEYESVVKEFPQVESPIFVVKPPLAPILNDRSQTARPKDLRDTPPAAPAKPNLASIRIASQKTVVSTNPNLPFALEVVLQTDQTIQPVSFVFMCDGNVGDGHGGVGAGAYMKTKKGIVDGHPDWFLIEWETPDFEPATPMVVILFSATAIHVTEVRRAQYFWP